MIPLPIIPLTMIPLTHPRFSFSIPILVWFAAAFVTGLVDGL
jgi:hypothetical protein